MSKLVLSPKAKSDISAIWDYSLEAWGVEQTEIYIRQIWANIQRCADNPEIASLAYMIRAGYRKILSGSHIIYFKEIEGGIDVVRVLHQSMDFKGNV